MGSSQPHCVLELSLWRTHIPLILFLSSQALCGQGQASWACSKLSSTCTLPFLPWSSPLVTECILLAWCCHLTFGLNLTPDTYMWNEAFRELIKVQRGWQWGHSAISSGQWAWKCLENTLFYRTNKNSGFHSLNSFILSLCLLTEQIGKVPLRSGREGLRESFCGSRLFDQAA